MADASLVFLDLMMLPAERWVWWVGCESVGKIQGVNFAQHLLSAYMHAWVAFAAMSIFGNMGGPASRIFASCMIAVRLVHWVAVGRVV